MADSSLAPSLLVAMPQMLDPNFTRTVVLLCEHGPQGTMGLVINRPTTTRVTSVVRLDPPVTAESDLMAWIGGPVETNRAWIVSGIDTETQDRVLLADGLFLSGSAEALRRCLVAPPEARRRHRFLLGYAGWGPGQLERELSESAWLNAPAHLDLIFDTPADDMWDATIRSLGIAPHALQMGPGVH